MAWSTDSGFGDARAAPRNWAEGQEVLLAFRPEGVEARAAEGDGAWVGVVRSSVYVGGHVEYVVDARRVHGASHRTGGSTPAARRARAAPRVAASGPDLAASAEQAGAPMEGDRDDQAEMGGDRLGTPRVGRHARAWSSGHTAGAGARRRRPAPADDDRRVPQKFQAAMAEWKSKIVPAAKQEGEVIWYSCAQATEAEGTITLFNKAYPDIQVSQVLSPGLSARGEDQHRGRRPAASRPTSISAAARAGAPLRGGGWRRPSRRPRRSIPSVKWRWPIMNKETHLAGVFASVSGLNINTKLVPPEKYPEELLGPRARPVLGRPDQAQARGVHRSAHRQHRRLPHVRPEGSEREGVRRALGPRVRRAQAQALRLQRVRRGGARRAARDAGRAVARGVQPRAASRSRRSAWSRAA